MGTGDSFYTIAFSSFLVVFCNYISIYVVINNLHLLLKVTENTHTILICIVVPIFVYGDILELGVRLSFCYDKIFYFQLDENNPERSRSTLSAVFNAVETSIKSKFSNASYFWLNKNADAKFIQAATKFLGM